MPIEQQLRRVAAVAAWITIALGAAGLLGALAGVDFLPTLSRGNTARFLPMGFGLIVGGVTVVLDLAGSWRRASLVGAIALGLLGVAPTGLNLHASIALVLAAGAIGALQQQRNRNHWPVSAVFANLLVALSVSALIALAFQRVTGTAGPLMVSSYQATGLLVLGISVLLARPEDKFVRMIFDRGTAGVLARRLLFGSAVIPLLLTLVLLVGLGLNLIGLGEGIGLLLVGLILCGFAVALFSAGAAVEIHADREEAEQARLLLTARLQEQAAQLQETVGIRTRELREANASLRAIADSNALLATVAEHTTNGVVITDAEGRIEWVNAAYTRITGYALDDLKGRKPGHVLQGSGTDPETIAKLRAAEREKKSCRVEILNYNKSGHAYWAAVEFEPVRDRNGRITNFIALSTDITEQRAAQDRLQGLNERLRLALRSSNYGVWALDLVNDRLSWDEQTFEIYGVDRQTFSGEREVWRRLLHPSDYAHAVEQARRVITGEHPTYDNEFRIIRPDGLVRHIEVHGYLQRDATGRPVQLIGLNRDVTERKHLEERVRKSEELAADVALVAQIGGWEYDVETQLLTWTDGVRRIHEVEDDFQPTLDNTRRFYPPDALETLHRSFNNQDSAHPSFDYELPLVTAAGQQRWVRMIGRTDFDAAGKPVRVHGAMQDITVRHESEQSRRELETQLFQAQKMETLGTLAGGIAHDFNNLLTGIIGYHELAADSVPEDHPARACLAEARNASLRARELVEQILTFGRQSPGGGHVPLDLGLVAEEARRFLRSTLPAMISIELDVAPDTPPVLGDGTQIHQVLLNLGSNAAHAMRHHGGTLTIAIAPAAINADLAQFFTGSNAGSFVRVSVRDTGHGMDEATRRRIFDPFFTTKNTREGTGLGLAVVHGIIKAHRGAIDVDSKPGAGATFHIYLPAATPENELVPMDTTESPRGEGEFICIVDDEEVVGTCTKLVLESKGYLAVVYRSAEECLEAMQQGNFNCSLLVTDQTMPGMQGTELVAAVRQQRPTLPVVIMSGYFSKISPEELDELGQVELLAKPFTTDELTNGVHRALHPKPPA